MKGGKMKGSKREKFIWLTLMGVGMVVLFLSLFHDYFLGKKFYLGILAWAGIATGLVLIIISSILFFLKKFDIYERKKFSKRVYLVDAVLIGLLFVFLSIIGEIFWSELKNPIRSNPWAIGVYLCHQEEPFNFSGEGIENPILKAKDITDMEAEFIADPFLIKEDETFYLFFEAFNTKTKQGDIGLAASKNGLEWIYQQVVLDEPYHLSYPCVFKYENEYYMLPACGKEGILIYYKANPFPLVWSKIKTLGMGKRFGDCSIFNFQETWWLFSETIGKDTLELHYSDNPFGPWTKHPKSPVKKGDPDRSSPAGQIVVLDNRIIRYAKDVFPYYGNQVWAFEILKLTRDDYEERLIGGKPILKGFDNWNTRGMHHVSPLRLGPELWMAAVDGY